MSVLDAILKLFNDARVNFKRVDHEHVTTSEEAAKVRGSSLDKGAKAIVCFANRSPVLIVVPGDMKIDFKAFKQAFGFKDLRLASPDEVTQLTELTIGSIPPLGKVLNLKSYYDESIKSKGEVVFNAGSHTTSLFMNASDLISVENPDFGNFAVQKK